MIAHEVATTDRAAVGRGVSMGGAEGPREPVLPPQMVEDMAAAGSRWRGWMEFINEELAKGRADPASSIERPPLTSEEMFNDIKKAIKEEDRKAIERQEKQEGAGPAKGPDERQSAADPASREERQTSAGAGREDDGGESGKDS